MKLSRWGMAMVLAAGLVLGIPSSQVRGQAVNGTLLGTVTDASGAVIPNAVVVATEVNTNISRTTKTNESGNYVFSDVTPGKYSVSAEQQGFKKEVRANVDVLVNSTIRVDLSLETGTVTETINVTAEAPMLQTDRADTGRKIETKQVEDLPIVYNNRNFQGLLNLVPGTTRAFRPHSQFFNPQDSLATQVNGNSRLANNLQLEGVDDNERTGLLQVYIPPIEAISTVDVTTSNYEAELGRAGGAVTNVVLKGGTNDFHGSAYAFNKLGALNARGFFDRGPAGQPFVKPKTVYNYDGANVGGPIKKDKIFFFGDFLRISDLRGQTDNFTAPTMDFRSGNLSAASTTIYDPATGDTADCLPGGNAALCGTGRTPFLNNMIPANRIDPIAQKILNLVPPPNRQGFTQNLSENSVFSKTSWAFDVKVDANPNSNNRVSGRFSYFKPTTTDPPAFGLAGGPHGDGFQGTGTQKTYVPGVNWDHIFSSTLITETRFGIERYRNDAQQSDFGSKASDAIGIPGVNVSDFTSGLVSVNLNGGYSGPLVGYSASLPWIRAETNILLVNNWTKTHGNHTIKWGIDVRRIRDDLLQTQTFNPRGTFNFEANQTALNGGPATSFANNFASFLLGVPNQVGRDLPIVFPTSRITQFFTFGQDKWQVSPKLTVDIGLRWEFYPPATPQFPGGYSNYNPDTNNLVVAGIGDNPSNLGMATRYRNFAPRLGVAYRLSEKTVIRSGFGISYEPFPDNTYAFNFPVKQNNAFNNLNAFGPALLPDGTPSTFAKGFPPPSIAAVPSNGIISASTPLLINQTYDVINKQFKNPYIEAWNLAVQRALPHNFTFEAAYVGNHGVDIATVYNVNAGLIPGAGNSGQPLFQQFGRRADTNLRFVGTSNNYNALQVKFDHRSGNFLLTTAYTYGKSLGITSEDGGFRYYINPRRSYGRTNFDRTHAFVQSYVYDVPFGKGKTYFTSGWGSRLLGGWEVSGVLTLMTGRPLDFGVNSSTLNAPGNGQSPNVSGPIRKLKGVDNDLWFDTSVFSAPPPGTFGNVGRFILAGPGFFNLDAALFKRIALTERVGLELRAEGFSVTNTPQFDIPDDSNSPPTTRFGSVNFGHIRNTVGGGTNGGARVMELGAKLTF